MPIEKYANDFATTLAAPVTDVAGTVTTVALSHPPGWAETQQVLGDRLHVLVPETAFKRFYYYRNRGYLTRRYGRVKSLIADGVGYPLYFLKRRDPRVKCPAPWIKRRPQSMKWLPHRGKCDGQRIK